MAITMNSANYGGAPLDLGRIEAESSEMMFVQYLPLIIPDHGNAEHSRLRIPANVDCFRPIIDGALADRGAAEPDDYVYLSAKNLYVTPENMGNRHGWHSDGFGTDDINYIWYDSAPTEFCVQPFTITQDCTISMREMADQADEANVRTYPEKHLLRLDQGVIHRVSDKGMTGFRTFVKISISKDQYNLLGNAHNYLFDYAWPMHERAVERNHPSRACARDHLTSIPKS